MDENMRAIEEMNNAEEEQIAAVEKNAAGDMFDEDRTKTEDEKRSELRSKYKIPEQAQRGVLKLFEPIISRDKEVYELHYDFTKMSGKEVVACLDVDPDADNNSSVTNKQALFLFSTACAKMEREISGLDAVDVRTRLSARDMIAAVRVGRSFFAHSLVGAHLSIFKM